VVPSLVMLIDSTKRVLFLRAQHLEQIMQNKLFHDLSMTRSVDGTENSPNRDTSNVDTLMAFITLELPSPPKLMTEIPLSEQFETINCHLCKRCWAINLLSVPRHAKQNGGAPLSKG